MNLKKTRESIEKLTRDTLSINNFPKLAKQLGVVALKIPQTGLDVLHHMVGELGYSELEYRTKRDELTGAFNRRGLYEAVNNVSKNMDEFKFMGVFIDIVGLGEINNKYSHAMGDNYLIAASWVTHKLFQLPEDQKNLSVSKSLVARWGGDEFVALMPGQIAFNEAISQKIKYHYIQEDDKKKNIATFGIDSFMSDNKEIEVPLKVRNAMYSLIDAGVTGLNYSYKIENIVLTDKEDDFEHAIERFMRDNSSKYVRQDD